MSVALLLTAVDLKDVTGLTHRQIDLWSVCGMFGDDNRRPGSGRSREFTVEDAVVGTVLRRLSLVCGQVPRDVGLAAAGAVRDGSGRWLVVEFDEVEDPYAYRTDSLNGLDAVAVVDVDAAASWVSTELP